MIVHLNFTVTDIIIIVIISVIFCSTFFKTFKYLSAKQYMEAYTRGRKNGYKKGVEDMNELFKTFSKN